MILNKVTAWTTFMIVIHDIMGETDISLFKKSSLNNYDCPVTDMIDFSGGSRSKLNCVQLCSRNKQCKSVFYMFGSADLVCHGSRFRYDTIHIPSLINMPGSVYYKVDISDYDFTWGTSGYKITDSADTFDNGIASCNEWGGYPVVADTNGEQTFLKDTLWDRDEDHVYIGLHRPSNTDWVWQASGEVLTDDDWYWTEPDGDSTVNCVIMYGNIFLAFQWADDPCSASYKMLCEASLV